MATVRISHISTWANNAGWIDLEYSDTNLTVIDFPWQNFSSGPAVITPTDATGNQLAPITLPQGQTGTYTPPGQLKLHQEKDGTLSCGTWQLQVQAPAV